MSQKTQHLSSVLTSADKKTNEIKNLNTCCCFCGEDLKPGMYMQTYFEHDNHWCDPVKVKGDYLEMARSYGYQYKRAHPECLLFCREDI